ncbi:MAG: HD domain-containing protein [Gemmatimonadales bacterium]|nr:HD domain-containing protein [Gemmatimonadales bacterium]
MTGALGWLHSFGRALSAYALYGEQHQSRRDAGGRLHAALGELLALDLRPAFTFLEHTVIYREQPVHGLKDWGWGRRLGAVGIRRLEFTDEASRESVEALLAALHDRVTGAAEDPLPYRWPGVEAGDVAVRAGEAPEMVSDPERPEILLGEELDAMRFILGNAQGGDLLPLDEVEAVVRALVLARRTGGDLWVPLLVPDAIEDHSALQAVNSAVLAMSFGEWLGLSGGDIRAIGKAALLHDIGMARVPRDIFRLPGLTDAARESIARHPETGARLLAERSPGLDLAATVAYEHHVHADGRGYPLRRYHQEPHYVSRIVSVAGAYNALRSPRSYRPARPAAEALLEIDAGAGRLYDGGVAHAFVRMMRRWEAKVVAAKGPPGAR